MVFNFHTTYFGYIWHVHDFSYISVHISFLYADHCYGHSHTHCHDNFVKLCLSHDLNKENSLLLTTLWLLVTCISVIVSGSANYCLRFNITYHFFNPLTSPTLLTTIVTTALIYYKKHPWVSKTITNLLNTLLVRSLLVSLDTEETDSSTTGLLLQNIGSSVRRLVTQWYLTNWLLSFGWRIILILLSMCASDSVNVLLVRVVDVGSARVEEHNQNTSKSSPEQSSGLDTNMSIQVSILEGVSGQNRHGGLKSSCAGNEKQRKHNQKDHNLINDDKTEAQEVNNQGKPGEGQTQQDKCKGKSRQVVVSVSVANEIFRNTSTSSKVVHWRNWEGWANLARTKVARVTHTPESP